MRQFRIAKFPKPQKAPKPPRFRAQSETKRLAAVAEALSISSNEAMVACSSCVASKVTCYYDRERSMKCAECLRHQRDCDGTFSLEEFRQVGEQKKLAEAELLKKKQLIAEARRRLVELEDEGIQSEIWLNHLKDVSGRMIEREMAALGVLAPQAPERRIALGDQLIFSHPLPDWSQLDFSAVYFSDDPQAALDGVVGANTLQPSAG